MNFSPVVSFSFSFIGGEKRPGDDNFNGSCCLMMEITKTMMTCLLAAPGEALGCSDPVTVARNHREVVADESPLMVMMMMATTMMMMMTTMMMMMMMMITATNKPSSILRNDIDN